MVGDNMNNLKNTLFSDIRDFNIHLVLLLGVLFISLVGAVSYAIFSTEVVSSNNISITVG